MYESKVRKDCLRADSEQLLTFGLGFRVGFPEGCQPFKGLLNSISDFEVWQALISRSATL
jgi:hypothetical protein